ncbi:MAG TPA: WD40 repeat domain-containing protein [Pyrinomonadaceae bacterium]|nr:WD40 repeat domain-containing protein [Pyrinomonadaceae bacterium]
MKPWWLLLLVFFFAPGATAQTRVVLEHQVDVPITSDGPLQVQNLPGKENRLLLRGEHTIKVFDFGNASVVASRRMENKNPCEDGPRAVSPDGRFAIIFGNYNCGGRENKIKRRAAVWNLETGKQIAVLDKSTKAVTRAKWSTNGKTLVTSSENTGPDYPPETVIEISFWDGENFAFKNSLPDVQINWFYLTNDGSTCFYSLGPIKKVLYLFKYLGDDSGPLKVWDIASGKVVQTIGASEGGIPRKMRAIDVSPDERFLTFVAQPPNTKDAARRQVVLEIDSGYQLLPRYELTPQPHIWEGGVFFSPEGKYFALRARQNVLIYETSTGAKKSELVGVDRMPAQWFNDDASLLFEEEKKLEAIETFSGKSLYKQPLVFKGHSDEDYYYIDDKTVTYPHPQRSLLLSNSNQYLKIFNSVTGELLQTLVEPQTDHTKKTGLSDKRLVSRAGWSPDGRYLFYVNYEFNLISVWRFVN